MACWRWLPESPRFLVVTGRLQEARDMLAAGARLNNTTLPAGFLHAPDTLDHSHQPQPCLAGLQPLFSAKVFFLWTIKDEGREMAESETRACFFLSFTFFFFLFLSFSFFLSFFYFLFLSFLFFLSFYVNLKLTVAPKHEHSLLPLLLHVASLLRHGHANRCPRVARQILPILMQSLHVYCSVDRGGAVN